MKESSAYFERSDTAPRFGKFLAKSALKELGLKQSQFVVVGGTSLLLRGLREDVADVDLLVDNKTLNRLRNLPNASSYTTHEDMDRFYGATNATVHLNTAAGVPVSATTHMDGQGRYTLRFAQIKASEEIIDGLPCISLEEQIASKMALRRAKDIDDLRQIHHSDPTMNLDVPEPLFEPSADLY